MPGFFAQLQAINRNLSLNQKLSMLALGTVTLFGILAFVYLFNQSGFRPLATDADPASQQQILSLLEEQGISADVSADGRSILVPSDLYREADRLIRSEGLVKDGRVGFDIFDDSDWSITDFGQKIKFLRALQGRLERSIQEQHSLRQVRVHLSLEEDSLFVEQRKPARASVQVTPFPGKEIGPGVVRGIQETVAGSVKGLVLDNVSVIGPAGLLSRHNDDDRVLSERQLQFRRRLEDEMRFKVISILEPLVGTLNVGVSLDIDYEQIQQKELLRDPVLEGEERTVTPSPGADAVGGIPGLAANQGAAPQSGPQTPPGAATRETRNYSYSTIERMLNSPGGSIEGISMSVVVDHKTVQGQNDRGRPQEKREPWTEQELEGFRELVTTAVSLKPERGDRLSLINFPFPHVPSQPLPVNSPGFLERNHYIIIPALRYMGILILFLLFYLLIFRPIKRRVFTYVEKGPQLTPGQVRQLAGAPGQAGGKDQLALSAGELSEEERVESEEERYGGEVTQLAQKRPEVVTDLVQEWLTS